jgi:hypothetical protein
MLGTPFASLDNSLSQDDLVCCIYLIKIINLYICLTNFLKQLNRILKKQRRNHKTQPTDKQPCQGAGGRKLKNDLYLESSSEWETFGTVFVYLG